MHTETHHSTWHTVRCTETAHKDSTQRQEDKDGTRGQRDRQTTSHADLSLQLLRLRLLEPVPLLQRRPHQIWSRNWRVGRPPRTTGVCRAACLPNFPGPTPPTLGSPLPPSTPDEAVLARLGVGRRSLAPHCAPITTYE